MISNVCIASLLSSSGYYILCVRDLAGGQPSTSGGVHWSQPDTQYVCSIRNMHSEETQHLCHDARPRDRSAAGALERGSGAQADPANGNGFNVHVVC